MDVCCTSRMDPSDIRVVTSPHSYHPTNFNFLTRENDGENGCDLFHGEWFYDSAGPLYTNNSCPVITQMQNCQGSGRPEKDYASWRWRRALCELPRFNATKFLEVMSGKTLAFVGNLVAKNQMQPLLCLSSQTIQMLMLKFPKTEGTVTCNAGFLDRSLL